MSRVVTLHALIDPHVLNVKLLQDQGGDGDYVHLHLLNTELVCHKDCKVVFVQCMGC